MAHRSGLIWLLFPDPNWLCAPGANNNMRQDQFAAIMPYISTDLVGMIAKKNKISENDAITKLYNSKLYAILEQEETKVWQYSTEMLYSLFEQEEETGKVEFPDV